MTDPLHTALKAVQLYAETHPRPVHVTCKQACEMLGVSGPTLRRIMASAGVTRNACGLIPIVEVDRLLGGGV